VHRSMTRLAVATVAALTLAACAGGDDDAETAADTTVAASVEPSTTVTETTTVTTVPATTQPATTAPTSEPATTAPATTQPADGGDEGDEGDDDVVIIDELSDLPEECRSALADFLRQVEPVVADIDWDTATLADFERINLELEDEGEIFDQTTEECGDFDFASDEESMQAMIEFAEEEAPGTVGWLEFIGEIAFAGDTDTGVAMTCEEAIAYFDDLIAGGATTMNDLPVSELAGVTAALDVVTTDCDFEVMDEFLARDDVTAFLGG
jgi:hypothetical protein